jgi:uncharacterized protein YdaU (DUF1376 family)
MKSAPYLPLFTDDFFGGTLRWSGEAQALYLLLMAHQWASGPLPKDEIELAGVLRYEIKRFRSLWSVVRQKYTLTEDGWVNERVEEHRLKAQEVAKKRSEAGKQGGFAKALAWQNSGKTLASASDLPGVLPKQKAAIPSHPIPNESKSGFAACADTRKGIFDLGKSILGANSGSLISGAIKRTSESQVGAVLGEMSMSTKADPRAYFVQATTPKRREVVV